MFEQTIFLWSFITQMICQNKSDSERIESENDSFISTLTGSKKTMSFRTPGSKVELSLEQTKMMRDVFNLFDTDGMGSLEEGELATAIFAMGFSTSNHREMAKSLISQYNGSLNLEQFTELMGGQLAGSDPEEEIRNAFFSICGDYPKVQVVTFPVLKAKVKELKIVLSEAELHNMILDASSNKQKAEVGLEEYIQILKNSTWI